MLLQLLGSDIPHLIYSSGFSQIYETQFAKCSTQMATFITYIGALHVKVEGD